MSRIIRCIAIIAVCLSFSPIMAQQRPTGTETLPGVTDTTIPGIVTTPVTRDTVTQTTTGTPPTVTINTKSLADALLPYVIMALGSIITALGGVVAYWLKQKWNIDTDAKHLNTLEVSLTNAASQLISTGLTKVEQNGRITVPDSLLANAAKSIIETRAPDAINHYDMDTNAVKTRIVEKISQLAGVPTLPSTVTTVVDHPQIVVPKNG